MRATPFLAIAALGRLLANGMDTGRYPVSGDDCKASDPGLGLGGADCTPPVAPPG
jgi:hypothetical protein